MACEVELENVKKIQTALQNSGTFIGRYEEMINQYTIVAENAKLSLEKLQEVESECLECISIDDKSADEGNLNLKVQSVQQIYDNVVNIIIPGLKKDVLTTREQIDILNKNLKDATEIYNNCSSKS